MAVAAPRNQIDKTGAVGEAVDRAIGDLGEVGVQVAAYLDGKLVIDVWRGSADTTTGAAVTAETVFNVFSVTKAVSAVALHMVVERGGLDYDTPISDYWPEFAQHGKTSATVRDAVTHRTGIPQMPPNTTLEQLIDWEHMVAAVAALEPMYEAATKSAYHGYTFGWIVGELVHRGDPLGRRIDQYVSEEICAPLGIESLWLGVPAEAESRVATLVDQIRRLPPGTDVGTLPLPAQVAQLAIPPQIGTTPDNYGRSDVRRAVLAGTGAIGDARSVARFFAMLAGGGALEGVRLLREETVRGFCRRLSSLEGDEFDLTDKIVGMGGLHLPVPSSGQASYYHALGTGENVLSHAGTGGQLGWADLDTSLAVGILHNRLFSPALDESADPLRLIADAVRESLGLR